MRWLLLAALLCVSAASVDARLFLRGGASTSTVNNDTVTLYNFVNSVTVPTATTRISEHDINGNGMDAHSGSILHYGGYFYEYGEHHGGGYRYGTAGSPAPGFNVYRSPDLVIKTRRGYIIDPSSSWSTTNCAPNGTTNAGCFRPHMLRNNANNNFVLFSVSFIPPIVWVTTCTAPDDPATCGTPTAITLPHDAVDFTVFVDNEQDNKGVLGGTAYLIYTVGISSSPRDIYIQALDSTYTTPTGSTFIVCDHNVRTCGEAPFAFSKGGKINIGYGSLCGYCGAGSTTFYVQASTPLTATWSAETQIDTSNGCSAQSSANVNVFTIGGHTTYLFGSDAWYGLENQGLATKFVYPLTFTGDAIDTITCPQSVTVSGITQSASYPPSPFTAHAVDQSNSSNRAVFNDGCEVTNTQWLLQTFTPTQANLYGIGLPLGKNNRGATNPEPDTDGDLIVGLYALDGSGNPTGAALGSGAVTIAASALTWVPQWTTVVFNATLTPATAYGIVLKGSGITASSGCFANTFSRLSSTYAGGTLKESSDSGSTWGPQSADFMFETYSAI
jgi:hypothetical protein